MAQNPYPFSTMVQKTSSKVWRPNMGVAQWARVLATRSEDPHGEAENQLPRLPQSQHVWPGTGTPHNKLSNFKISKQSQTWSFCFLNTSWIRNQSCLKVVGQLGEAECRFHFVPTLCPGQWPFIGNIWAVVRVCPLLLFWNTNNAIG